MKPNSDVVVGLKAAIKKYSRFYFHGERVPNAPSYSDPFTFKLTCAHFNSIKNKEHTVFEIIGNVHGGHTNKISWHKHDGLEYPHPEEGFRPVTGFWSLGGVDDYFKSAIRSIPNDAELSLEVYLDSGTNEILMREELHCDTLILHAKWSRGEKQHKREYLIGLQVGRHNSARFGYSV